MPFLVEGASVGAPALVATSAHHIDMLRAELDGVRQLTFLDMPSVGRNPACIIPVWQDFIDRYPGQELRGIGEPIWAGRSEAELDECHRHEALLNRAIAQDTPLHLLCPYDASALDPATLDRARHTHPMPGSPGPDRGDAVFAGPAPRPPAAVRPLPVDMVDLRGLAARLRSEARGLGLGNDRADDVALVGVELCTNAIRHGGGAGAVAIWQEDGSVICQVEDGGGPLVDPLVGRRKPLPNQPGGRGLWLVNHLSDLVQIRSAPGRTTITARWSLDDRGAQGRV